MGDKQDVGRQWFGNYEFWPRFKLYLLRKRENNDVNIRQLSLEARGCFFAFFFFAFFIKQRHPPIIC